MTIHSNFSGEVAIVLTVVLVRVRFDMVEVERDCGLNFDVQCSRRDERERDMSRRVTGRMGWMK
jgi:hypothetical protein